MADVPQQAAGEPLDEALDPANQSLADALRKSFRVLKVLMLVLVVLYFLSGWFSVKLGERGIIYRMGRIVGVADGGLAAQAVLGPGWKWSWPFPIDRWQTIQTSERELPLEFMLALTANERSTGVIERKFGTLSPERDDYLVTGDTNILHASLTIKYRISNVIDYVTNVYPMLHVVHSTLDAIRQVQALARNSPNPGCDDSARAENGQGHENARRDLQTLSTPSRARGVGAVFPSPSSLLRGQGVRPAKGSPRRLRRQ